MSSAQELADIEQRRYNDEYDFLVDCKKAYIEYVKILNPWTWWWSNLSWFVEPVFISGWTSYLKYTPIWNDYDHWFNKKWEIRNAGWHSEYRVKRRGCTKNLYFDAYAWLCFIRPC